MPTKQQKGHSQDCCSLLLRRMAGVAGPGSSSGAATTPPLMRFSFLIAHHHPPTISSLQAGAAALARALLLRATSFRTHRPSLSQDRNNVDTRLQELADGGAERLVDAEVMHVVNRRHQLNARDVRLVEALADCTAGPLARNLRDVQSSVFNRRLRMDLDVVQRLCANGIASSADSAVVVDLRLLLQFLASLRMFR